MVRYSVEINWRHPHTALGYAVVRREGTVKRFVAASYVKTEAERIADRLNEQEAA